MDPHYMFSHRHVLTRHGGSADNASDIGGGDGGGSDNLENLYPALVECFGIILLGYIAGKFSLINDVEAKGLGIFVGKFSLPALIFVSLCQLNLTAVNWNFLAAGSQLSVSALCAIFCTQSNDFALGYPVLSALYGESHPEYPMYLYLLAPVSLAFLNPIGFIIIEIGKSRNENNKSGWKIFKKVTKSIMTNPLIVMTFFGIIGNLLFHSAMPAIIHEFMATLGSAFSGSALFLLGLRMVDQSGSGAGKGLKSHLLTFLLIMVKSLVLPLVTREIVSQMDTSNSTDALSNYGFLYGTIPTAPSVFVYASSYNLEPELFAGAITASTFLAAPLMYISAKMMMLKNIDPDDYIQQIDLFLLDISVIGVIAALWVIFVLVITKRGYSMPHQMTLVLTIFQGVACAGAILWSFLDCRHGWRLYVQFIIWGYGVFGARYKKYILGTALIFPLILVASLTLVVAMETKPHGNKVEPNFQYGITQAVTALVILILSMLTTVICLILHQRNLVKPQQVRDRETLERQRLLQSSPSASSSGLLTPNSVMSAPPSPSIRQDQDLQECGGPLGACPVNKLIDVEDMVGPSAGNSQQAGGPGPVSACQAARLANGNGGGAGANGRRYRCDSTHREYCTGLMRRYEVPPGEDALSPDNIFARNTQPSGLQTNILMSRNTQPSGLQTNILMSRNTQPSGLQTGFDRDEDPLQLTRHKILLILLCLSMFVGGALCVWTLFMESMSGIYLELVFIDGFLNFGQSIFSLVLFAINVKGLQLTVRRCIRRLVYGSEQITLPPWEDLDAEDRDVSARFIKHHIETCMEEILHDINQGIRRHSAAFFGSELVDWLVEYGLAHTKQE